MELDLVLGLMLVQRLRVTVLLLVWQLPTREQRGGGGTSTAT